MGCQCSKPNEKDSMDLVAAHDPPTIEAPIQVRQI